MTKVHAPCFPPKSVVLYEYYFPCLAEILRFRFLMSHQFFSTKIPYFQVAQISITPGPPNSAAPKVKITRSLISSDKIRCLKQYRGGVIEIYCLTVTSQNR